MRKGEDQGNWRCAAAMKDLRNTDRIRIACRNDEELQAVKRAAEKAGALGIRVLRDQLFPLKLDNVNRTAILNNNSRIRLGAAEIIGKENHVKVEKIIWLSNKDNFKAYRSMAVFLNKDSDVQRLLKEQFFHIAGESATTAPFTPFLGPVQCYKC
jgi:hypothetical protein